MLSRFSVQRLQAVGNPFDSRTMHAVEARRIPPAEDGVVVEELLTGYAREDEILRLAEVAVNRLDGGGGGVDGRDTRNGSKP